MEKLDFSYRNLRKFGVTMAIAFAVIALIVFIRHRYSIIPVGSVSVLFLILALGIPEILKPVYIFWMKLAFVLSWFNTRLILIIIFYLIFTPISLCLKLFKVDLLDRRMQKTKDSYWRKREEVGSGQALYERQF